jgi:hypothetical protein
VISLQVFWTTLWLSSPSQRLSSSLSLICSLYLKYLSAGSSTFSAGRLNNRQRIANAREKPIEANKNQSVDGAEGLFLRSGSPQNVYLLPQRQNFHLERCRDRNRSTTIQTLSLTRSLIPQQHRPILDQLLVRLSLRQGQVSFVDKFILKDKDTGLGKILKDKGITTVIAVGTAAHGAVLYTASAAALRGFNVIVPVDGMSGDGQDTYIEQYVAYNLTHAPILSPMVTLTRIDIISFSN